jgi:hypothetical protein
MEDCGVPGPIDMDEVITLNYITRMLSDNYTLLIICGIIIGLLIFILTYFVKLVQTTIKEYHKNSGKGELSGNTENEIYSSENDDLVDPTQYQAPEKRAFLKSLNDNYKEYNIEKTQYIKATYGKDNDDYIDGKISYRTYDDYEKN